MIDGASSLARKLKMSELAIGLTIVAFGTSMPEFFIALSAFFSGAPDISLGNIIGSNISNLLLVGGLAAIISTVKINHNLIKRDLPFNFILITSFFILVNNFFLGGDKGLSRSGGAVLLLFFLVFLYFTFSQHQKKKKVMPLSTALKERPVVVSLIYLSVGMAAMIFGGGLVVEAIRYISSALNLTQAFLGYSIVAIGTTLPELTVSIMAVIKNKSDLAVGNIIGSNVFNIGFILGLNALFHPIAFSNQANILLALSFFSAVVFYYFAANGKKREERVIKKWEGVAMVSLYFIYLTILVLWV